MVVFGRITRNDVRKAVRESRKARNICSTCLVAVILSRLLNDKTVEVVGYSTASYQNDRYTHTLRLNHLYGLINLFDSKFKTISNIDKFYREIKALYPGKIQLTY